MRVQVVATNDAGSSPPATSSVSTAVVKMPPVNLTAPLVTGTARDEVLLTSTTGTWDGTGPLAYTYQWQRCDTAGNNCVAIAGATASTYRLADADVGHTVRSTVRATNDVGNAVKASAASAVVLAAPPADKTAPVVSGTSRDGQVLTASAGTWSGTGPFTYGYEWLRCDTAGNNCVVIPGATGSTYELTAGDVGHTVRTRVTATNGLGSDTSTSSPSAVVQLAPPSNDARPALAGTARDEQTLTATTGGWDGTGPLDYAYQWQRCDAGPANCVAIAGATGASYTLTDADAGKVVRVVVTASNGAGQATATSVPTVVVAKAPPAAGAVAGALERRRHADRRHRLLDRHRPLRLHLPVAALRRGRQRTASPSPAPPAPPTTCRPRTSATRCAWSSPPPTRSAAPPSPRPRPRRSSTTRPQR